MCWTRGSGKIIRLRVPAWGELWTMLPFPRRKFRRISSRPFCAAWLSAGAVPNGRMVCWRARTVPNCPRLRGGGGRRRRQVAECGPSSRHQRRPRLHKSPPRIKLWRRLWMSSLYFTWFSDWVRVRVARQEGMTNVCWESDGGAEGGLSLPEDLLELNSLKVFSSKKHAVCTAQSAYI